MSFSKFLDGKKLRSMFDGSWVAKNFSIIENECTKNEFLHGQWDGLVRRCSTDIMIFRSKIWVQNFMGKA